MLSADRSTPEPLAHAKSQNESVSPIGEVVFVDPLLADADIDPVFQLSEKQISRLITVAAQTGIRFHRASDQDPVAWMYQTHALFSGRSALDACRERLHYHRAMISHGLALSAQTTPEQVDGLLCPVREGLPWDRVLGSTASSGEMPQRFLYTVSISDRLDEGSTMMFLAFVAEGEGAVMADVSDRFGERIASQAVVRCGFDPSEPVAVALVSEAIAETLHLVADAPDSSLANGFEIHLEARSTH